MNTLFRRRGEDGVRAKPPDNAAFVEGLPTYWYLARRCEDECYRAERYGRSLTLLVVELVGESDALQVEGQLRNWLRSHVRLSDIAGYLGDGCYAVLLPETDRDAASGLETRLRWAFPRVKAGISVHPEDGRNLEDLIRAARRSTEA